MKEAHGPAGDADFPALTVGADETPEEELPEGFYPMRLVMRPGGLALVLAKPELLLGRHSAADVRLPLPDVSRRHCRFVFVHGGWRVVDLDSLNGVWLNGERVAHADLHAGDSLRIGGFTFEVETEVPAPTDAAGSAILRSISEALPHRRAG